MELMKKRAERLFDAIRKSRLSYALQELAPSGSAVAVGFLCSTDSLSYSSFLIRPKSALNGSNSAFVI